MIRVYRCHWCEWRWPLLPDYEACPFCREPTYEAWSEHPMDEDEANKWRLEFTFGWWLWETGRILDPATLR